jgi:hypothetical protein
MSSDDLSFCAAVSYSFFAHFNAFSASMTISTTRKYYRQSQADAP